MQAVFRLVKDDRLGPVDDIPRDLLAAVGGKAVHDDSVRLGIAQQLRVDLVGLRTFIRSSCSSSWPILAQTSV